MTSSKKTTKRRTTKRTASKTRKKLTKADVVAQEVYADEVEAAPEVEEGNLEEIQAKLDFYIKENSRLNRKLVQDTVHTTLITDAVEAAYDGVKPIRIPARPKFSNKADRDSLVPVLVLSDWQLGKETATYNMAVARERIVETLFQKFAKLVETQRAGYNITECRVYMIGDMVEGELIFPHQAHEIECSVFDQAVHDGPSIAAELVARLMGMFDRVTVRTCAGNHGRPASKHAGSHPRTNWDNVFYEVAKLKLLLSLPEKDRDRLVFEVSDDFYFIDYVWEHGFLNMHGDTIRGGFAGLPFYGISRKITGYADAIEAPWDTLLIGHFHNAACAVQNYHDWKINGTTESGNGFALAQLAAAGHPNQRCMFVHQDHGVHSESLLWLTDERLPTIGRMRRALEKFDSLPQFESSK